MRFAHLSSGPSRREQREEGDASSLYPHFGVAHLVNKLDPAAAGCGRVPVQYIDLFNRQRTDEQVREAMQSAMALLLACSGGWPR